MRIGLSLIAATTLFAIPVVAADWQQLVFPDQQFVVETPVSLVKGSGTYRSAIVGAIPTVTYTGELDKIRYRVTIIDISKQSADPQNLFEEMESLIETQGKVLENDSQRIDNGKLARFGRELLVQARDGSLRRICLMYANGRLIRPKERCCRAVTRNPSFRSGSRARFCSISTSRPGKNVRRNPDNFRADPAIKN